MSNSGNNRVVRRVWLGTTLIVILVVLLTAFLFIPDMRVVVHQKHQLVGPEDRTVRLIEAGAPLSAIADSINKNGSGVDGISWMGASLLTLAVEKQRYDLIEWLLAEGADPDGIDPSRCPLYSAVALDDAKAVRLLLEHGADPTLDVGHGATLRDVAVYEKASDEIIIMLNKGVGE